MDVRAIIVLGGAEDSEQTFAHVPLPCFDVLGRSPLLRILDRLAKDGVGTSTVVSGSDTLPSLPRHIRLLVNGDVWQLAERAFVEAVHAGADCVIAIRMGPYAEVDFTDLLQYHAERSRAVTGVADGSGEFSIFALSTTCRNESSYVFRHHLRTLRNPHDIYPFSGYWNPLLRAADLRRLAIDSFCRNADMLPEGVEVRPGIWLGAGATISKRARIVAPVFIGAHAIVKPSAVVTRCSTIEHHGFVSSGAVVDNASVLASTRIGPALDVVNAVVGLKRYAHLGRDVEIEIADHRLVGSVSAAPVRLLEHVALLAAYLPIHFLRGLASSNRNGHSRLPSSHAPYPALSTDPGDEFPANLAGVRRYGND